MKENTKNQIQTLMKFLAERGNTMTVADIANVNESIDNIYLKLEDSEEDFPNKNAVIDFLKDMDDVMRKTPYFNLVQNTWFGLNGVMYLLK